jgi:uncharacterized membrane-anchored protein YjiN (DUF445 family)
MPKSLRGAAADDGAVAMAELTLSTPWSGGDRAVEDQKAADLRRMRTIATLLLVLMTIVFVATSFARVRWEWLDYVRAFAEAGMVGACADWFAVVALFRHPLGIPIPHTGIVPRNKARIGAALGRFITNNFLTPKVLSEKLVKVDAAQWVADWLADPENAKSVAHRAAVVVPEVVRALPRDVMADALGRSLVAGLKAVPAGPVAANLLGIVWAQGETQKLLDRAITVAESALIANKAFIRARVEANSSRWVPRWLDGIVADKITSTIAATLTEMRDPAHPWRIELKEGIEGLIGRLGSDPSLQADVEAAKNAFLDDPGFAEHVTVIWREIDARLPSDVSAHADTIATAVEHCLLSAGRWIGEDPGVKEKINNWIRYLVRRTISPRRAEIGAFVTNVVEAWDSTTLVNRLELQVGKDLQYIRINGTLVGGLVGLLIFTVSKWLLPG